MRTTLIPSSIVLVLTVGLVVSGSLSAQSAAPAPDVDWNRFYSSAQTHEIMRSYAERYPELTELYSIGKSYLGKDLWMMEVTNERSGPTFEKPALYVDGGIHSGELTGAAVTLYLLGHLLDNYGKDIEITSLLDTRVFYVRPKFNPDGADLALLEDASLRSSVRPWDNDGDDAMDEDPSEDLNGDGFIVQMRFPDPDGNLEKSPEDPRIMVRRERAATGGNYYRVVSEGIDNDNDGRLNEDGIGGLDMNRNFPRNWELQYMQPGAGPFPLSEPETYATVKFIDAHPNITGVVHNHTSGGFVYRLPSASDPTKFDNDDLALIETLGAEYTRTTGRPVRPSSTDPVRHRYGTLISWAYWDRGVIGWVPEYWPGVSADTNGDGRTDELERIRYFDEHFAGKYFVDWTPFDHPEFGPVEIGGWRRKFVTQNPPPELLEAECALQMPWILYLAAQSPILSLDSVWAHKIGEGRFEVNVAIRNRGFLPTHLTERGIQAEVVQPVVAIIDVDGGRLVEGERRTELGHLAGTGQVPAKRSASATGRWVIEIDGPGASARIEVRSEKGGVIRTGTIELKSGN